VPLGSTCCTSCQRCNGHTNIVLACMAKALTRSGCLGGPRVPLSSLAKHAWSWTGLPAQRAGHSSASCIHLHVFVSWALSSPQTVTPSPYCTRGGSWVRASRARRAQLLTYLDRSSLAFAAPDMIADLGLDGASYGLGAGLLFVTYSALMLPGSMLVEAVGAPTGLAAATVAWGAITALTALVRAAPAFYAVRLALGAAEACCFPGVRRGGLRLC